MYRFAVECLDSARFDTDVPLWYARTIQRIQEAADKFVELSWQILDPIEKFWSKKGAKPDPYPAGGWGPTSADEMMRRDGREWRLP